MCERSEDPVARFEEVAAAHARCFWLDGGGSRPWSGRRSIIGWLDAGDTSLTLDAAGTVHRHRGGRTEVLGTDIFAVLEQEMAGDDEHVHWVGYFGYASRPDLPAAIDPDDPTPVAVWMRATNIELFEHAPNADAATESAVPRHPGPGIDGLVVPEEYAEAFARVQEELRAGNSYEVNLTYRLELDQAERPALDPVAAYLRLRAINPAPYAGFLQHEGTHLLSSSPERYATIDRHRRIETKPIKGTTPRGATPEEDEQSRQHLATDPKFRAENLMIVDLLRNDLSMVCTPGTVEVPVLMEVESYETVHQLVSTVRGELRDDVTTLGALRALFPAGSMTGAPKLRTMEIISEVEATPRGVYSGAFGWISGDGRADLGVVIRSLYGAEGIGAHTWQLGTGGGITVASDVTEEYAESCWKAERLLAVRNPDRR